MFMVGGGKKRIFFLRSKNSKNSDENKFLFPPIYSIVSSLSAFDHSRVHLDHDGDEDEAYINANFVNACLKPNAYIATQGPLPSTVKAFWKMVCKCGLKKKKNRKEEEEKEQIYSKTDVIHKNHFLKGLATQSGNYCDVGPGN